MKIIECPRDAMQGIVSFIPTEKKIDYINMLLKVGFDTIDFGSFVSPKAIPQMKDTHEVLAGLDFNNTVSKLLAIVANVRGAQDASVFSEIKYLGFPFSISETFQLRNTNSTIETSLDTVKQILEICGKTDKELVLYVSMAFGNPYGDEWNSDIACNWVDKLNAMGVKIIAMSDTVGVADPKSISYLFSNLIPAFPKVEFGAHLHTTPETWREKVEAAYSSGCRRFDAAIKGFGGCPMAKDDLVGNMPTEKLISFFEEKSIPLNLDMAQFERALNKSLDIFPVLESH